MGIKQMIKHLSRKDQDYILSNKELVSDVVEQGLDQEEIDALLTTARFIDIQRKNISIK
ncbi:MAG: hypothetical protein WCG98_05185 [bacterium]